MIIIFYNLIDEIYMMEWGDGALYSWTEAERAIHGWEMLCELYYGWGLGTDAVLSPKMRCTRTVIVAPKTAINAKDQRSPANSATDPTRGGTMRNPKYPTVETAAIADPLDIPAERPAMLKTIGMTQETPKPVSIKPSPAVKG